MFGEMQGRCMEELQNIEMQWFRENVYQGFKEQIKLVLPIMLFTQP